MVSAITGQSRGDNSSNTRNKYIYGYVETKKGFFMWRPCKVLSCDVVKFEVHASKRGPKALLAIEDVQLQPAKDLVGETVENEFVIEK